MDANTGFFTPANLALEVKMHGYGIKIETVNEFDRMIPDELRDLDRTTDMSLGFPNVIPDINLNGHHSNLVRLEETFITKDTDSSYQKAQKVRALVPQTAREELEVVVKMKDPQYVSVGKMAEAITNTVVTFSFEKTVQLDDGSIQTNHQEHTGIITGAQKTDKGILPMIWDGKSNQELVIPVDAKITSMFEGIDFSKPYLDAQRGLAIGDKISMPNTINPIEGTITKDFGNGQFQGIVTKAQIAENIHKGQTFFVADARRWIFDGDLKVIERAEDSVKEA